jgi:hypothetical protein
LFAAGKVQPVPLYSGVYAEEPRHDDRRGDDRRRTDRGCRLSLNNTVNGSRGSLRDSGMTTKIGNP